MVYHQNNRKTVRPPPEGMFLRMVDDPNRLNEGVKPVLKKNCKDKIVIDLGCGTGILGLYALENGAKFIYFVEQDDYMVEILKNSLHKIIDQSKFKIIHSFAQELKESDFENGAPELCVSELWGIHLFDEGYYHCTNPLKQIFKDLTFIPDIFHLDIFECDVDYNSYPWPQNEKHLVEHYKYMYSTTGWSQWAVGKDKDIPYVNPKKIGEIRYDANAGIFNNLLNVGIHPTEGKMINMKGTIISDGIETDGPKFGWYMYPDPEEVMITVFVPKDIEDSSVQFIIDPTS